MENNISPLISGQVPESLRESSPLFLGFVETYYKYAELRKNSGGMIGFNTQNIDIDDTLSEYVDHFYSTYGAYLPKETALDPRNLIKLLNDVYSAKGTEKALKLIFLALFDEQIGVTAPGERVLRASDGIWESESFITLVDRFGSLPSENVILEFTNVFGDFSLIVTRIQPFDAVTNRIYFNSYDKLYLEEAQLIYVYDNITRELLYAGELIRSPSRLSILNPGKSWQAGQVIVVPGTVNNTIARVKRVSSTGQVLSTEILDYGFRHSENQVYTVSPYPNKPISNSVEISSVLVSTFPNVYHHTIDIVDYTDGTIDEIVGVLSGVGAESYFLEAYTISGYVGQVVIAQISAAESVVGNTADTTLTIEEWLASRATFQYEFDNVVKTKGYYKTEAGQLSNQEIRLQDNYFYQAFSYLIETSKDIRDYKSATKIAHPAGTKRFSNLSKTVNYDLAFLVERTISSDTSYILDIINTDDNIGKYVQRGLSDTNTLLDSIYQKQFNKNVSGIDFVTLSDGIDTKYIEKVLADISLVTDVTAFDVSKLLNDFVTITDIESVDLNSAPQFDSTTATDVTELSLNKVNTDSVTITGLDNAVQTLILYDAESYFLEAYTSTDYILTIG